MEQQYMFENVRHALVWSTEVMRRGSRPSISRVYEKGLLAELESAEADKTWTGWRAHLPENREEKLLLVAKVWNATAKLSQEHQRILRLSYFGDWYSEAHLATMLALQERMRKEGKRLRLNHRYSVRQVATILDMNYRTVHRKLDVAMVALEKELAQQNILEETDVFAEAC